MKKHHIVFVSGIILVVAFALGDYFYEGRRVKKIAFMASENAATFVRPYSPVLGSDDAKVYIVEFLDPACETCSAIHPYVKDLLKAHPGRIKLVIRYAPLHDNADYFVKILEAARKQGKYWETLEVMFKTQSQWASHHDPQPKLVWKFLPMAGLNLEKLARDMEDPEIQKIIKQDITDFKTLGAKKTPEFFVNGKPLPSFGLNQLIKLVEAEIKAQY